MKGVREGETRGHREKPIPFPSPGTSPFRNIIRGQLGKKHSCGEEQEEEDGYEEEGEAEEEGRKKSIRWLSGLGGSFPARE